MSFGKVLKPRSFDLGGGVKNKLTTQNSACLKTETSPKNNADLKFCGMLLCQESNKQSRLDGTDHKNRVTIS